MRTAQEYRPCKLNWKLTYFDEKTIDSFEFKQWTYTDRSTLKTKIQSVDEILQIFLGAIPKLTQHDFIAKQQASYLQLVKSQPREFLLVEGRLQKIAVL